MMIALIGVLGALAGTVAGSLLTQILQRQSSALGRLHDARIDSYGTFAAAAMDFRRAQMGRWFTKKAGRYDPTVDDVYEARSRTWAAYYRVVLLTSRSEVIICAGEARDLISSLKDAASQEELNALGKACREAVSRFADAARQEVMTSREGAKQRLSTRYPGVHRESVAPLHGGTT